MSERIYNGKTGEWVRWALPVVLAGLVAYFTAIGAINTAIASVAAKEDAHFNELLRHVQEIRQDVRELRQREP